MRSADCDIVIVAGLPEVDPDHWPSRWSQRLSTARIVAAASDEAPDREAWIARIAATVREATRPVVLVAHGLGVVAVAHAAPFLPPGVTRGGFLVGLHDVEEPTAPPLQRAFAPIPRDPFPFPSLLVASRDDPHCSYERAEDFSHAWGSAIVDAGASGHLDAASGHGPWPEGLMRFAGFLKGL